MYANSALALTGTGMSVGASAVLPSASELSASGTAAADLTATAVDAARVLLMATGAGFGLFLLAMTVLLAAGAVLRGADAVSGRSAPRGRRAGLGPASRGVLASSGGGNDLTAQVTR
ncbi:hypothetical protein [Planomonospora venezuelensis]|uniref:Phage-related tail protein n=1 Tax=Planomonospora venezuelensis TaxID=1999 RepID=A0A841DEU7_PLAVE|nr:hypothetical protein [Planomonospora venezuelensis]MBB5967283.1 phage-related tail protein [Planomonospora venezuelensis]GIM98563.1 hypothetical protein Pve01_02220 [Planomonospora venezuelensis]